MNASRARAPPKGHAVGSAGIETYLEYARENIERSRMLFEKGDLRYAVFSANEGLELYIKAYMLHYKIIDKAIAAGHFPYPVAVQKMIEITRSNIRRNPANKKQLEQTLKPLLILKNAFKMLKDEKIRIPVWKSTLGISLADDERNELEKFRKETLEWNKKMVQIQGVEKFTLGQDSDKCTPGDQADFFATIQSPSREKSVQQKSSQYLSLPRGKRIAYSDALDLKQIFALVELFIHLDVIANSFSHQQVSRYPTHIDGVDSRTHYMNHKDDVKKLLDRIYDISEKLSRQVEYGEPFQMQSIVSISADMKKFMPPRQTQ